MPTQDGFCLNKTASNAKLVCPGETLAQLQKMGFACLYCALSSLEASENTVRFAHVKNRKALQKYAVIRLFFCFV